MDDNVCYFSTLLLNILQSRQQQQHSFLRSSLSHYSQWPFRILFLLVLYTMRKTLLLYCCVVRIRVKNTSEQQHNNTKEFFETVKELSVRKAKVYWCDCIAVVRQSYTLEVRRSTLRCTKFFCNCDLDFFCFNKLNKTKLMNTSIAR